MKKIGVVIGRFQVPELHLGHLYLINFAREKSDTLLILIGTTQALPSRRNPLDFSVREAMVKKAFPDARVAALPDHPSDTEWSMLVDRVIEKEFPFCEAILFGSRDSFRGHYSGKFPTVNVPEMLFQSGTIIRRNTGNGNVDKQFLSGMIYAQNCRPDISYQAVDIAVIDHENRKVLMGKKKNDDRGWRFIGGFVDPHDMSLEGAAMRELREEAGRVDCHELTYLGSIRIADYRYSCEGDKIMTAFFLTYRLSGRATAGDDMDELAWVPIEYCQDAVVEEHNPLAKRLVEYLKIDNV